MADQLALQFHPDKNPHPKASEAFKKLNAAYGVLSDPEKKRVYDLGGGQGSLYSTNASSSAPAYEQRDFCGLISRRGVR